MNAPAKDPKPADRAETERELEQIGAERRQKRGRRRLLMLLLPLVLALGGGWFWLTGGRYVTTDNAYVQQPIVPVSADVPGRIVSVTAKENDFVEAGTTLFQVDPAPYQIALNQAEAALAGARLSVEQMRSAYTMAQAKLDAAGQVLDLRQREFERQKELGDRGLMSASAIDSAQLAVQAAENDVALSRLGVREAAAALGGDPEIATDDFPTVRAALAARDTAQRNLANTTAVAPAAGFVSQTGSLNVGQYVGAGSTVASLVESDVTWVEANFKETQLAELRSGQPVSVDVDAYPGVALEGTVASIGSATGAEFSLIPPQNATGNWVKVVQRIPVRIRITPDPDHPLRGGMSVFVSVDTGANRMQRMGWAK